MTKADAKKRLAQVEAEYRRVLKEIAARPGGNGFASQEDMRQAAATLYGSTIAALRQISIPLGVGASALLCGERVTRRRAAAAGIIGVGIALVVAGASG